MRYAVLADIHANLHALSAVLDKLSGERLDGYLCAGDLVGYGPQPNECVELIAELGATCVAGNHDLIAIGRLGNERCSTLARTSLEWTSGTLQPAARRFLAGLPLRAHAAGGVVLSHGSLEDPQEYVTRTTQVRAQLHHLNREHPSARLLVLGHTHIPGAWDRDVAAHSPARRQPLELVSHPWLVGALA